MAASATTIGATTQFYIGNHLSRTTSRCISSNKLILERRRKYGKNRQPKLWVIKISNSGDTSAEAATPESSVETAEERASLISAINVDKAFRGIAISEVDHYGRLGVGRECSYEEVEKGYNKKVDELMKQDLEEDEVKNNLQLLKESYIILSRAEERRLYDWSVARNAEPDEYKWPYEVDTLQIDSDFDNPPPQDPEDEGPTRILGYFLLAWLILSFVLSIYINS